MPLPFHGFISALAKERETGIRDLTVNESDTVVVSVTVKQEIGGPVTTHLSTPGVYK